LARSDELRKEGLEDPESGMGEGVVGKFPLLLAGK
jgi:hypothetical protein